MEAMIWFTSDLHLGYKAAISMCERPFENVEEMNETLIRNLNSCSKKNDTVYMLGDFVDALSNDVLAKVWAWGTASAWTYS